MRNGWKANVKSTPGQLHAEEQSANGDQDRRDNVCGERGAVASLPHLNRVETERGNGCETAQKALGEEQAKLLAAAAPPLPVGALFLVSQRAAKRAVIGVDQAP